MEPKLVSLLTPGQQHTPHLFFSGGKGGLGSVLKENPVCLPSSRLERCFQMELIRWGTREGSEARLASPGEDGKCLVNLGAPSPWALSPLTFGSGRSFHNHLYTCILKGRLHVKMDEASEKRSGDLQNEGLRTHSGTGDTRMGCWKGRKCR